MTTNTNLKRGKRAPLVGEKHIVDCFIQDQRVQALWDSGSQVTIIDELWKEAHLPNVRLRDIVEILDITPNFDIKAANGESMPYTGWVEATFRLASGAASNTEVVVPILVMKGGHLVQPIIGSNVIQIIIAQAFAEQVTAVVEQVSTEQVDEYVFKTKRERINIPKHTSVGVECHVSMDSSHEDKTVCTILWTMI